MNLTLGQHRFTNREAYIFNRYFGGIDAIGQNE